MQSNTNSPIQTNENELFPIFLKLNQLRVLIVGGGFVGLEKITAVLGNSPQAMVQLVAPAIQDDIQRMADTFPNVHLYHRPFELSDLDNQDIVIVATNDKPLNAEIKQLAKDRKILCNVADTPHLCDFYLSSVVRKGNLKVAISTNGKSPTVAKRLREVLEEALPSDLNETLDNLQRIRNQLKGDFTYKVKRLNELTSTLVDKPEASIQLKFNVKTVLLMLVGSLTLMVLGHLLLSRLL